MKEKSISIIVGLSRLGSSIASILSTSGEEVVVVDKDGSSFRKLGDSFTGFELVGDVIDIDVLEKAGIRNAKTIVATTDDDNVNIMISEISRYIYGVRNVFVRLNDNDKSILIESANIHAIYPFLLSLAEFEKVMKESGEEL
jgi:trk system potassium uptake protein TrkA